MWYDPHCHNFEIEKNTEQCFAIKFCFRVGKSALEMFEMLHVIYNDFTECFKSNFTGY